MVSLPYQKRFIITQRFLNPASRYASGFHLGVDLVGLEDKNIYAITSGTVLVAGSDAAFGNTVVVQQDDGLYCRYSHLEVIQVKAGQKVANGQTLIGIEGKTGNVVGSGDPRHLDLRLSKFSNHTDRIEDYRNPCEYLGFPNTLNYIVKPEEFSMERVKNIIICPAEVDKRAAGYLADYLNCKIIESDLLPASVLDQVFENVYAIGTAKKVVAKSVNIYGADRYETCEKVLSFIKEARSKR